MRAWAWLVLLVLAAPPADAHERPRSRSGWTVGVSGAAVIVEISRRDAAVLLRSTRSLGERLPSMLKLWSGHRPCALTPHSFAALPSTPRELRFSWRVACSMDPATFEIESRLSGMLGGHVHLASIRALGETQYFVLGSESPRQEWKSAREGAFVRLGVSHVLTGGDHLLFVLLLVALAMSPRQGMGWVFGFSLGHALSIALASLGWVQADSRLVEIAIALSIALAAVELGWKRQLSRRVGALCVSMLAVACAGLAAAPLVIGVAIAAVSLGEASTRWSVARLGFCLLFGLVHGLGFAGGLLPALPDSDILLPLLQFNVGVEVAQLLVAAGLMIIVAAARRRLPLSRDPMIAAAGLAASCYWLVVRGLSM